MINVKKQHKLCKYSTFKKAAQFGQILFFDHRTAVTHVTAVNAWFSDLSRAKLVSIRLDVEFAN